MAKLFTFFLGSSQRERTITIRPVVFIWRTTNFKRRIQDDLQWHTIYDEVLSLLAELVGSFSDSLTHSLTHWQTDWSNYLDILIKDSVGTNWLLSRERTLLVSLLPALHPLQYSPLSDCSERLAERTGMHRQRPEHVIVSGNIVGCAVDVACVDVWTSVTWSLSR